ncbi:TPA: hypothetical protein ACPTPK_005107, partial [Escherichia coli]
DPDSDIDSQFEEVTDFLDYIRYLVEADQFFESKHGELVDELERAKKDIESKKSNEEDEGSFFNSVPRAVQRDQQDGRSVFSDVDE